MTEELTRLRAAAKRLARIDDKRAAELAKRDAAIVAALEAGATWVQVQEATGLSPSVVKKAIERHHQR